MPPSSPFFGALGVAMDCAIRYFGSFMEYRAVKTGANRQCLRHFDYQVAYKKFYEVPFNYPVSYPLGTY